MLLVSVDVCSASWISSNPTAAFAEFLDFSSNSLSFGVPEQYCTQNPNLEELVLGSNTLTGTIPACIGTQLKRLRLLDIKDSNISGKLPTTLGQLTQLEVLDFAANSMTGTLPTELGNLVRLQYLLLRRNLLTGTLPTQLGNLRLLETLNIGGNLFSGTVPEEYGNLKDSLDALYLEGNPELGGTLPERLCISSILDPLATNIGCGVACSCCSDLLEICGIAPTNARAFSEASEGGGDE